MMKENKTNYNEMGYLANFLTTLSLAFGFASIIFSLESHFTYAAWAIIFAVVFDGLDGQAARRGHVASDFGRELDSLADVVSFGIAPSMLGYIFVYQDFYFWATSALFIYLVASVVRLAKYNITPKEESRHYFYGLPTTMSGGLLASFILIFRRYTAKLPPPRIFFLLGVLILAYLMVSKVRYPNLDMVMQFLRRKKIWAIAVILLLAVAIAGFFFITGVPLPEVAIFTLFLIYLLFSPFMVKSLEPKH